MNLDAEVGRGCDRCPWGEPFARIQIRSGHTITLCLECTWWWFPNKSADWLESRNGHLANHVDERLAVSLKHEREVGLGRWLRGEGP